MDEKEKKLDEASVEPETKTDEATKGGNPAPKTFTQEEVNSMIESRLAKSKKSFYAKLGVENEEGLNAIIQKANGYDALKTSNDEREQEIATLKAEKIKSGYIREIEKANVDTEFTDFVYSKVKPQENEDVKEYKVRLEEYIAKHKNVLNANVSTYSSSVDLSGASHKHSPQSLEEAMIERYKD